MSLAYEKCPRKSVGILNAAKFAATLEAPPRFELGIKLLQSSALPLGYGAICSIVCKIFVSYSYIMYTIQKTYEFPAIMKNE